MLSFYGSNDCYVEVETTNLFHLDMQGRSFQRISRAELESFRNAIDQALNTSQDEIDAAADA